MKIIHSILSFVSIPFLVVLLLMGYLNYYLHGQSRREYRLAQQSLQDKKIPLSIHHYGKSIQWYSPFSSYPETSIQRLLFIGNHYVKEGDWEDAMLVFQELRNSLSSIRSYKQPYAQTLQHSQQQLAKLLQSLPGKYSLPTTISPEKERKQLFAFLATHTRPLPSKRGFSVFFFTCWIFSTIGLFFGEKQPYLSFFWGITALFSFFSWMGIALDLF